MAPLKRDLVGAGGTAEVDAFHVGDDAAPLKLARLALRRLTARRPFHVDDDVAPLKRPPAPPAARVRRRAFHVDDDVAPLTLTRAWPSLRGLARAARSIHVDDDVGPMKRPKGGRIPLAFMHLPR